MNALSLRTATIAVLLYAGLTLCVRADTTGSFSGIVTDASGGAISKAKLVLLNAETGFRREDSSSPDGSYEFLAVPIGAHYSISVETPGFRKALSSDLTLEVNQRFRMDFQLVVGQVTEAINVSGSAVQVETQNTPNSATS